MSVSRAPPPLDDDDDAPLHHSSLPALARSWPSSPLSLLSSSRQVTSDLYSSLQHSRQQEVRGHAARQVSFALSSPDLTALRATVATPPLPSDRLEDCSVDSASCRDVIGSGVEGEESEELSRSALSSGRRHIEEMESVRTHLQSILRPKPTTADRHGFLTPALHHFLDDSHESDDTSHLLSAGCVEELFPRYSRLRVDSSGAAELQVLRESLQRERERRKVCEQQVASLHSKVLQFQQQLTLAVAADRKKDIMIEQLDKTLVKVVEGWKRHDQELNEEMKSLQEEKEAAQRTHNRHTQALSRVEKNLSQVEETLNKEQKHNQELQKTNKQLEQQVCDLRVCVEDLQQEEQKLRREGDRDREQLHTLQTQSHNTHTQLQQHIQELQQQLQELQQQLHTQRERVKQEVAGREEAENRKQRLQEELDTSRSERDAQMVERAMEQTRFEAQKSQMEAEFRLSLEQQLTERLTALQEENATHNTQLRQQHRKQLLDLSARHERELAVQLDHFTTQLQERDDKLQQLTHTHQHKLSEMQEELLSMAVSKRKLETQREELVSRLQGMMRSHWAEALRLLTNQEQMESVLSPVHQWETPTSSSSPPQSDTHVSAAPQAVVLRLSREKERETSVMNCSSAFSPLEPQLEHSHLTGLSDCSALWFKPVFTEEETRETQTNLNLKLSHAPTDIRTNHSSCADSGQDRGGASGRMYCSDAEKATPIRDQAPPSRCEAPPSRYKAPPIIDKAPPVRYIDPPIREEAPPIRHVAPPIREEAPPIRHVAPPIIDEAPPNRTRVSSRNEDRQSELQYYVSKLLERSPGDPLDEPIREQRRAESADEQKPDELDKPEARASSRPAQSRRSSGRRGGSHRVWR
ncbi:centrobin [Rhinichthys klamathensis goyatoka]|uniref:centrobin n=1 Tax=Rhinichthys klamathensis goyatoka TaxID=3034132 RepID=UPI0024B584AF|nr:centrobin [Rhinichthys klamathensis goyatoka]